MKKKFLAVLLLALSAATLFGAFACGSPKASAAETVITNPAQSNQITNQSHTSLPVANATVASPERITTTLYAYPTLPSWKTVESSTPQVNAAIVDICAPDGSGSGCNGKPATGKASVWVPTLDALRSAKIQALYYIDTSYGKIPLSTVEGELKQAVAWYGTASPMFDQVSTSNPSYYAALYKYAVSIGAARVMFNAGTQLPESYVFGPKAVLQVFEGTEAQFQARTYPSWMDKYPASYFSATVSAGTANGVKTDVSDAKARGIGNIYIDDQPEPPNYAALPAFWSAELAAVGS